ncbi:MAG: hypothetical protein HQL27_01630 [Candidatus Omnitrophica bacterium]|nr:hypothetical protein [Candidatus Omnitrophota bacterium]
MKTPRTIFFVLTFLFLSFQLIYSAEKGSESAQSFSEQGILLYKSGDVKGAIDRFSRSLLLDPHNKTSQNNLIAISTNEDLNAKQKLNLFLLEDLITRIKDLKDRIDYFTNKRDSLADDIIAKGYKQQLLEEELDNIMNYAVNSKEFMQYSNTDNSLDSSNPLEEVNSSLLKVKEQLSQKVSYLKNQLDFLRNTNKETFSKEKDEVLLAQEKKALERREYWDYLNKISEDNSLSVQTGPIKVSDKGNTTSELSFLDLKNKAITPEEDINLLKQALSSLRNQVNGLQKNIDDKDKKVTQLSSQIVNFAVKLDEKEGLLTSKAGDLAMINKDFQELQARFEAGQKAIQEKDTEIEALKKSLEENEAKEAPVAQAALAEAQFEQDKKIVELNGVLESYRAKLGKADTAIKERESKISSLSNNLAELQKKFEQNRHSVIITDRTVSKKDKEITALKSAIDRMRNDSTSKNEKLQNIIKEKYAKIEELAGVLDIYKNKLLDANSIIKEKALNIQSLEQQLTLVQAKLSEKDEVIKKTNANLHSLETQLQEVQDRLLEIKDSGTQTQSRNPWIEDEIASLKEKIGNLNELIKQELREFEKINGNLPQQEIENLDNLLE